MSNGFPSPMEPCQYTIRKAVSLCGIGLHSGRPVNLTIKPAEVNSGIRFLRADIGEDAAIQAFMDRVIDTSLATTIAEEQATVSTTEHLLAALVGMGIDNAVVEIDGPEVPIMDGSAGPFVHLLRRVERRRQKAPRWLLKVNEEIGIADGDKTVRILPYDGFKVTSEIDFSHDLIQHQSYTLEVTPKRFAKEIAAARTFGFMEEVELLRANGFALGGSLENAVVVDRLGVVNEDGLRFSDEFVRHKILDLIGDLALLGYPLLGHVVASKSGHAQHLRLMQEVAARPECWEFVRYEKNDDGVLKRVVSSTRAAGNRILPYLVPPSSALAGSSCPA